MYKPTRVKHVINDVVALLDEGKIIIVNNEIIELDDDPLTGEIVKLALELGLEPETLVWD